MFDKSYKVGEKSSVSRKASHGSQNGIDLTRYQSKSWDAGQNDRLDTVAGMCLNYDCS